MKICSEQVKKTIDWKNLLKITAHIFFPQSECSYQCNSDGGVDTDQPQL